MTKSNGISIPTTLTFPIKSEHIRKIPDPTGQYDAYYVLCPVENLPDIPTEETNPREQNLQSKVAKEIRASLKKMDGKFHLLNRGITISADYVSYENKTGILKVHLSDSLVHGNIDGGHTQRVILDMLSKPEWKNIIKSKKESGDFKQQYVRFEIITSLNHAFLVDLAEARNTSAQVKEYALENLAGKFEWIKSPLSQYESVISYKENEKKPVNIRDVIALLTLFNIGLYPNNSDQFPTQAYSSKAKPLEFFVDDEKGETFKSLEPIMIDILKLYDYIRAKMKEVYNKEGGKFARWSVVEDESTKFHFDKTLKMVDFRLPDGIIYPLLGAFRFLVREKEGKYYWKVDNVRKFYDRFGESLIRSAFETVSKRGNNPNAAGKDSTYWEHLYNQVKLAYIELLQVDEDTFIKVTQ